MQRQTRPSPVHHDLIFAGAVILGAVAVSLLAWLVIGICAMVTSAL